MNSTGKERHSLDNSGKTTVETVRTCSERITRRANVRERRLLPEGKVTYLSSAIIDERRSREWTVFQKIK
jgi:hypothetical protein